MFQHARAVDGQPCRALQSQVGESVVGRPGGAVSLAVGMAQIFSGLPGMRGLMAYWYHFAIMFEALFILTTIDAGTRVGRFLLQEFVGRAWKPFARPHWLPGSLSSTSLMVLAWAYFIWTGSINTIWPMFGIANQLLAAVALAVGTTILINIGRAKYAWVTFAPLCFLSVTTLTAGYMSVRDNFWPKAVGPDPALHVQGYVDSICTSFLMVAVRHHPGVRRTPLDAGADRPRARAAEAWRKLMRRRLTASVSGSAALASFFRPFAGARTVPAAAAQRSRDRRDATHRGGGRTLVPERGHVDFEPVAGHPGLDDRFQEGPGPPGSAFSRGAPRAAAGDAPQVPVPVHPDQLRPDRDADPRTSSSTASGIRVGLPVNSTLDWKAYRFGYEYDFITTQPLVRRVHRST